MILGHCGLDETLLQEQDTQHEPCQWSYLCHAELHTGMKDNIAWCALLPWKSLVIMIVCLCWLQAAYSHHLQGSDALAALRGLQVTPTAVMCCTAEKSALT